MTSELLQAEAENCLNFMHGRFLEAMQHRAVHFPLTGVRSCRAFGGIVTETLSMLRSSESRLPPTALIIAMIRVCEARVNPPASDAVRSNRKPALPRGMAYEMLDRLRAELPCTFEFALDQVGRIVGEAGTLRDEARIGDAFRSYRARLEGAASEKEIHALVNQIWMQRYAPRIEERQFQAA